MHSISTRDSCSFIISFATHIAFRHQNNFLLEIFFPLVAQENNAHSRVPVTRLLLFSKLLRDVPESNVCCNEIVEFGSCLINNLIKTK